jgi:hypothetical protein
VGANLDGRPVREADPPLRLATQRRETLPNDVPAASQLWSVSRHSPGIRPMSWRATRTCHAMPSPFACVTTPLPIVCA